MNAAMNMKFKRVESPIQTQTIHYFDAYPGVGKTEVALEYMIKEARRKVCLYVAPRIALLKEVKERLLRKAKSMYEEGDLSEVQYQRIVSNHPSKRKLFIVEIGNSRSKTLGELLKDEVETARPGDIIFCTHENFVRNGRFERDHDEIVVVFDEARKMVLERKDQRIVVTREQKEVLFKVLDPYRIPVYINGGEGANTQKYSGFSRFSVPPEDERKVLRESRALLHETSGDTGVDTSPDSAFRELLSDVCNERMDVYLKIPLNLEAMLSEKPSFAEQQRGIKEKQSVFQVISPARMFEGFHHVLVLSAYFRQSQIYHLLKNYHNIHPEKRKVFDLVPVELSAEQQESVEERRSCIEDRFRKVRIYPILDKEQKVSSRNLDLSCLVPRDGLEEFLVKVERSFKIPRERIYSILSGGPATKKGESSAYLAAKIREVANRIVGEPPKNNRYFKRVGFAEPIAGYFNLSQYAFAVIANGASLEKLNCVLGRPLISVNKKHKELFDSLPPPDGAMGHGSVHGPQRTIQVISDLISNPSQEELERSAQIALSQEKESRVRRADERKIGLTMFDYVMADPMGLNTYRDRNFIAYLSARNPTPEVASLFKAIIPSYNADDDYAGDSAVQAVTRLSVRDANAGEYVYIIVPDLGLARILQRKLSRHHQNGDQLTEDHDGARIHMNLAKSVDYVDVLSVVPHGASDSRERQAITQKAASFEEMKAWPKDLVRLHAALNNPDSQRNWNKVRRHGVKNKSEMEEATKRIRWLQEFNALAEQTLRTSDKHLPNLKKALAARSSAAVVESMRKVREACKRFRSV